MNYFSPTFPLHVSAVAGHLQVYFSGVFCLVRSLATLHTVSKMLKMKAFACRWLKNFFGSDVSAVNFKISENYCINVEFLKVLKFEFKY